MYQLSNIDDLKYHTILTSTIPPTYTPNHESIPVCVQAGVGGFTENGSKQIYSGLV